MIQVQDPDLAHKVLQTPSSLSIWRWPRKLLMIDGLPLGGLLAS